MNDLMRYAALLDGLDKGPLPPVQDWRPSEVGAIDIHISADGVWRHEGDVIERARLVRLFSTILRIDDGEYYLVTPQEKLKIIVDDVPFIAVAMTVDGSGKSQSLQFSTNLGDVVEAGLAHRIFTKTKKASGEIIPYIDVRNGLAARLSRAVYYEFAALAEPVKSDLEDRFGVWSGGQFFVIEPCAEDDGLRID